MEEIKKLIRFYIINSELGNMVYVGSTEKEIEKRLKGHYSGYKQFMNPKPNRQSVCRVTSFDLFTEYGFENCKINELSSKLCSKTERDEIENSYIDQFKNDKNYNCVNKMRAGLHGENSKNKEVVMCECGQRFVNSDTLHKKHPTHKKYKNNIIINITNNITLNTP